MYLILKQGYEVTIILYYYKTKLIPGKMLHHLFCHQQYNSSYNIQDKDKLPRTKFYVMNLPTLPCFICSCSYTTS